MSKICQFENTYHQFSSNPSYTPFHIPFLFHSSNRVCTLIKYIPPAIAYTRDKKLDTMINPGHDLELPVETGEILYIGQHRCQFLGQPITLVRTCNGCFTTLYETPRPPPPLADPPLTAPARCVPLIQGRAFFRPGP